MEHSPGFLKVVDAARPRVRECTVDDVRGLRERGAPFRLVDVREDHEWARGHAAGAEHLGRGVLERDVEARFPDRDAQLVLYCGGGYRSILAADVLQTMGYTNVASMAGGWRAWTAAGLPVVVPEG
jgi:rhodanese-related sulfurtransferase